MDERPDDKLRDGDGLVIFGVLFWVVAAVLLLLAMLVSSTVEAYGLGGEGGIANLPKMQMKMLLFLGSGFTAIVGTLLYGFGKIIRRQG